MSKFFDKFMKGIPRGLSSRFLSEQTPPQARFQTPEAVYKSSLLKYDPNNPGSKILVGAMGDKLIGIEDERHCLTCGGSRAGKSVTLKSNLFFYPGSVLVIDPKGELASDTGLSRVALGQKVNVLDPFCHVSDEIAHLRKSYNPLSVLNLDSPTIIEDAGLIADALVVGESKDPHWDESARNFIDGLILHVSSEPKYKKRRNLITVRELINRALAIVPGSEDRDDFTQYVLEEEMLASAETLVRSSNTVDLGMAVEGAARDFFEKGDKERESVLSTARRHTKFLDYKAMKSVLKSHDFDLADLKRDPAGVSVYLCLPASRIGLCNRWLRIFINQLLDAMERERSKPSSPVLVCLDEFPVLGHMSQLEIAAGQIASFDVKLWTIIQDWSQGEALYGKRWETFVGNAGFLQFFGNNDLATTEYVAKRLGKTRVGVSRTGDVGQKQRSGGMTGISTSAELFDLLAPEEISRLFARSDSLKRQLVIWAGYHPMILQRAEYFDPGCPVHRYIPKNC